MSLKEEWPELAPFDDDYALSYDWEEDQAFYGYAPAITWRMTTDPFRLVPTWVRIGAEDTYEQYSIFWALAGESICGVWGIPVSVCDGIDAIVESLLLMLYENWYPEFRLPSKCDHE